MKIIAKKNSSYVVELSFAEMNKIVESNVNIDQASFKEDDEINIIDYLTKANDIIKNQNKIAELKAGLQDVMAGLGKIE